MGKGRRGKAEGYQALPDETPKTQRRRKGPRRRGGQSSGAASPEDKALRASITQGTPDRGKERRYKTTQIRHTCLSLTHSCSTGGSREIIEVAADGNCLFRALADQLYYDYGQAHQDIRADICDYLQAYEADFCHFLVLDDEDAPPEEEDAADFTQYLQRMRQDGEWGGNVELVAAARLYQRSIVVYSAELGSYRIDCDKPKGPDMMVSYHDNDHYNSVRDSRLSKPPTFVKIHLEQKLDEDAVAERSNQEQEQLVGDPPGEAPGSAVRSSEQGPSPMTQGQAHGKNAPCPCGSKKRYKKCCGPKDRERERARRKQAINQVPSEEELELVGPMRVMVI